MGHVFSLCPDFYRTIISVSETLQCSTTKERLKVLHVFLNIMHEVDAVATYLHFVFKHVKNINWVYLTEDNS